ncbi:MAG: GNAT family N-acetyltransferase [Anaerolineae bacterium]
MKCHYDDQIAIYRCARTGEYVCLEHARMDVVSISTRVQLPPLPVRSAQQEDYDAIKEMALMYWGETEVVCFDHTYDVLVLPAWIAHDDDKIAGMLSYALEEDRLVIVMLNVHPEYQGKRTARSLLAVAEREARARGLSRLVVATSNDDLPALYLYQRWGFVISEVKPGAILAHHGHEERGFASIPVRDEIRLERKLDS